MTQFSTQSVPSPILSVGTETKSNITFHSEQNEMLRIAEDGFYVRGQKLNVDENESRAVYKAFKQWLVWAALSQK